LIIVFTMGILLFLYILGFIYFLKTESRQASLLSTRFAARKLADMGLMLFKRYLRGGLRDPEFELSKILSLPLEKIDDGDTEIEFDLTEAFKGIVAQIEALELRDYQHISWTGKIIVNKDDLKSFGFPLARYPAGTYEKYGDIRITVTASVRMGVNVISATSSEMTHVKVNVLRIPVLADFTLFVDNILEAAAGIVREPDGLNWVEIDQEGKLEKGALLVLDNGWVFNDWRPDSPPDFIDEGSLKNQGWVYLGTGDSTTKKAVLVTAYGNGEINEDKRDEMFSLFQGAPSAKRVFGNLEFNSRVGTPAHPEYVLQHMNIGAIGGEQPVWYRDWTIDYGSGKQILGSTSSFLRPHGLPSCLSPTVVLGNVHRRYLRLSSLVVPHDQVDAWKDKIDIVDHGIISTHAIATQKWTYAPLYHCSSSSSIRELGSKSTPLSGLIKGGQNQYEFIFKYIKKGRGIRLWTSGQYRRWMTNTFDRPINTDLDIIHRGGFESTPEAVLEAGLYGRGDTDTRRRYPGFREDEIQAVTTDLHAAFFDNVARHFRDGKRWVWSTQSKEDDKPLDVMNFLAKFNFLDSNTRKLKLGTIVYSPSSRTQRIGGFTVVRGGMIVFEKNVLVEAPIHSPNGEVLTIVSLKGDIFLKCTSSTGTIHAQLVAPCGSLLRTSDTADFDIVGGVAVRSLPDVLLKRLQDRSISTIGYNMKLKFTPGEDEPYRRIVAVDICPLGDPVPTTELENRRRR